MFEVVRAHGAAIVLMHMRGEPLSMQADPVYQDVVGEVHEYLRERIEAAEFAGIPPERVAVDPGIGFGKDLGHNLELLRRIDAFLDLGRPVVVGPSRKRFIGTILDLPEDRRVEGTIGAAGWLAARGAHVVRVHDVLEVVRAVRVVDAITGSGA
jgi:dihydropteroate synthase